MLPAQELKLKFLPASVGDAEAELRVLVDVGGMVLLSAVSPRLVSAHFNETLPNRDRPILVSFQM